MTEWRLIMDRHRPAAENMAIDEAIMRMRPETGVNTFRLFQWEPSAISIGYFQSLEREVAVDVCEEKGIDVVRRITGGGAVYHDRGGEVTYSMAMPADDPLVAGMNVQASYGVLLDGLVRALGLLGMDAEFKPVNDVIVAGKKISGSAQTRRGGVVLQHGTVLLDVDVDLMFSLLKVPDEKIRDKMVETVKERVTSIRHQTGMRDPERLGEALVEGFSEALGAEMVPGALTPEERALVPEIRMERFGDPAWTGRR